MPTGQNGKSGNNGNDYKTLMWFIILAMIFTAFINIIMASVSLRAATPIKYSEFMQMVKDGQVESVEILSDRLIIIAKQSETEVNFYKGDVY